MDTQELLKKYKEEISEAILELKTPGKRHKQIPNILTFSRLLSPLIIIPTAMSGNVKDTTKVATFFGLTDLADGFIARKWNLSSPLGADLDAITDKVFAGTLLITGSIKKPFLLVNVGLEGIIALINLKEKMSLKKPSSTMIGKIKTGAIFTLGGLSVVYNDQKSLNRLFPPLTVATTLLQTMTIASYIKKYSKEETSSCYSQANQGLIEKLKEERKFWNQELKNKESQHRPEKENKESIQFSAKVPMQKIKS